MFKSLKNTIQSLEKNEISIKELSQEYIKNIKEKSNLNIFIHFDEQKILNQVEILEKDKSKKKLKGIPLAIKDLFCTKDMPTTAASKILKNFKPSYESFVTQKLLDCGAIFVGKTNLDEFAMGSATDTSYFGNTINPLSKDGEPLAPGGSSGGSAAAVADYKPVNKLLHKYKKESGTPKIELQKTKDILADMGAAKKDQFLVGFALETNNEIDNAKSKLLEKNLDLIILNSLKDEGAGFDTDTNKITILSKHNKLLRFELKSKHDVASDIVNSILNEIDA